MDAIRRPTLDTEAPQQNPWKLLPWLLALAAGLITIAAFGLDRMIAPTYVPRVEYAVECAKNANELHGLDGRVIRLETSLQKIEASLEKINKKLDGIKRR
jgi:hypothetical protein